ncbi:double-strand break repair protein AddB [Defluviimonas sp. WL0075]|uniref:Double-strand break repair protein AddB n=1 Tax=Albidovulum sediminicola TaxID=2984331 RepID=A0ABT2YXL0_9RHOB|nr:double-strand break repair protein AddB [Defluviimonas sp. WL0075]MCV2863251.1 double-strand break repair protein AddB [Defluviimonas sp. WL0075]
MFDPGTSPRLFALPPGADFPARLVEGLIARMADKPAEAMARVELYLNTARMQRRVRALFDDHGARFLPRLRLVTDLGRDPLAGLPPAAPALRRRLELAELVRGLVERLPDFAPGTPVFGLADSLARLLEEMEGEGVAPAALESPALAENHAAHWERSLAFLRIIGRYFAPDPSEAPPSAEARQRQIVAALAQRWHLSPPDHPVIVAGSTASRGTTALFMAAVARLPQGAVVLPGFDFDMPTAAWESLADGPMPAEDHPQYRFLKLARDLDLPMTRIRLWADGTAPDPARNRLISLALRPAPVTDQWMAEGAGLGDLPAATSGLTLIEAPSPRAEALALALRLREAAESGTRAALITPDRVLARRVGAALDRWGILPDDSAGQPLNQTAPGRFLRHVAGVFGRKLGAEALLVLLKHPLTATGAGDRGNHLRFARDLELKIRRSGPPFPTGADLIAWASAQGDAERIAWAEWLAAALQGHEDPAPLPLGDRVAAHLALAEALAAGPGGSASASELWRDEPGRAARRAMDGLLREAGHAGAYSAQHYADLVAGILSSEMARKAEGTHPLVAIWGTLEARVQGADLVLLGGLNEGVWPDLPAPDPWLSRQMRLKAGLLLPERRVGLSAHDFQQAAAAPSVVLSRAARDDEAETIPSRWLARLTNLLAGLPGNRGPDALAEMTARGDGLLRLAGALEEPGRVTPAPRPAPRPPVEARPSELPVTAIRTLIRDPYAVYAGRILRLRKLDPLRAEPDARKRGDVLHEIVHAFIKDRPEGETPEAARSRLLAGAEEILSREIPWPSAQRLWLAKLARIADRFVGAEEQRAGRGAPVVMEEKHRLPIPELRFTLTAKPDRIDLLEDGRVHIYDYKSGRPPSDKQQAAFDKQLLLEALMAERGAFAPLGPREVEGATYIHLGGDGTDRPTELTADLMAQTWEGLGQLIREYRRREKGYIARRAVFESRFEGDFDHLARYGEWEMADPSAPEDVG